MLTCPLCGTQFDPDLHVNCQACPLQTGCQLACCPNCGFEMVNVQRSVVARLAARWLKSTSDRNTKEVDESSLRR